MAEIIKIDKDLVDAAKKDQGQVDVPVPDEKEPLNSEAYRNNSLIMGNAVELISCVIKKIAGNDISTTIGNDVLTSNVLQSIAAQHLLKHIKQKAMAK